jgi:hypothetical protein
MSKTSSEEKSADDEAVKFLTDDTESAESVTSEHVEVASRLQKKIESYEKFFIHHVIAIAIAVGVPATGIILVSEEFFGVEVYTAIFEAHDDLSIYFRGDLLLLPACGAAYLFHISCVQNAAAWCLVSLALAAYVVFGFNEGLIITIVASQALLLKLLRLTLCRRTVIYSFAYTAFFMNIAAALGIVVYWILFVSNGNMWNHFRLSDDLEKLHSLINGWAAHFDHTKFTFALDCPEDIAIRKHLDDGREITEKLRSWCSDAKLVAFLI